jgi:type II secretory pathway predicted ATPase ExeA
MYTAWFKLTRLPFRMRPDPDFLYLPALLANQYARWLRTLREDGGACGITGDRGTGKTTLLAAVAAALAPGARVLQLRQPTVTPPELAAALCKQLGFAASNDGRIEPIQQLKRQLAQERGLGRHVAILVDDAQQLPPESLRLLSNIAAEQPAQRVLFTGTPTVIEQLQARHWAAPDAAQRAVLRLARFDPEDTGAYVRQRLKLAGAGNRPLFDAETLTEIQRYTGGTPRLINQLCDAALTIAADKNSDAVSAAELRDAVRELKWVEFAARPDRQDEKTGRNPEPAGSAEPPPQWIAELVVAKRGKAVTVVELRPGTVVIGRGDDSDVRLDSKFISRHHCRIVTTETESYVEDLGSTNGLLVNGQPHRMYRLVTGDHIDVGDHTLTYRESQAGPADAASFPT